MRLLASAVVVVGVLPAAGEPGPPPREVAPAPRVQYLGRYGYEQVGDREPLIFNMVSDGTLLGDPPVAFTDDDLRKIVPKYCDGHDKVAIVLCVLDPDKTTLRAISRTVERLGKYVPAKTAATFQIQDY